MSLQIAAQHLASKGRGPDTELVHMTKGEIAGLHALALSQGGKLTINPDTGLVEAGFLSSLLPMLAGAAANLIVPGSGFLVGGLTGYLQNPKGGLGSIAMGALGGYGGGSLASGLESLGSAAAGTEAAAVTTPISPTTTTLGGTYNAVPSISIPAAAPVAASGMGSVAPSFSNAANGVEKLFQPGGLTKFIGNAAVPASGSTAEIAAKGLGGGMQAAKYFGAAAIPMLAQDTRNYAGAPAQNVGHITPFNFTRETDDSDPRNPTVNQYYTAGTPITAPGPAGFPYQSGQRIQMAEGGITSLGAYSDGGQLLRGAGDGVSDNIPAVIGKNQPARLADGEFVVPARIVSEIGNGSTEAGARELYKMMARIQKSRSKTVGKNNVAIDAKARDLLPA